MEIEQWRDAGAAEPLELEAGLLREQGDRYELTGPLPPLAIPSTLQDSLTARLDRLATVKEVAQLGAALGRAFPYDLLRAVSPLDDPTLQRELARLVDAEILYQRGMPPQATYIFKHALIQEAAYQSLLRSTRQQYHQRVVLIEQFPEEAEARPEFVAHHLTEAGLTSDAIEYWTRAGQRALQRSANLEAISHFTRGVELLTRVPESEARSRQDLRSDSGWDPRSSPRMATARSRSSRHSLDHRSCARSWGRPSRASSPSWGSGSFALSGPSC